MGVPPTPGGGQNQTLLELIYSLKGLAQTVEFLHADLSRKLDEESAARKAEVTRLVDGLDKQNQALTTLPIIFSDRVERLISGIRQDINEKLRDVDDAVTQVRNRLEDYSRTTERAISQHDDGVVQEEIREKAEVTGRIELTESGEVRVSLNSKLMRKMWYVLLFLAAGGGIYGLKQLLHVIFGGGSGGE